jgi:hypothetical protein
MPVVAAAYLHVKGAWKPGPFSLGRASTPVTLIAALWLTFECVNIAWPRPSNPQWYLNWGVIIMISALAILGLAVAAWVFRPGSAGVRTESVEVS